MISGQRRITNSLREENSTSSTFLAEAAATVRTLIGKYGAQILPISRFRLLRVYLVEYEEERSDEYFEDILIRLLNLRLLFVDVKDHPLPGVPCYLWNLQTLFLNDIDKDYVLEIWKMPLLRLVITNGEGSLCLPDPSLYEEVIVLENLRTLGLVRNIKLSEEVLKRIPNVGMLSLYYQEEDEEKTKGDYYCLNNLHRLNKLRVLHLSIRYGLDPASVQELYFPYSLKELALMCTELPWEEMASKIGCLPLLQVLELEYHAFVGSEWETVEGQFSSLKFLEIKKCRGLECWTTDSTHFPRLEHLVLSGLRELREIPSSIGDIPTLKSIELEDCSDSAVESARRIQEEQEEYDNQLLQIQFKVTIR